MKYFLSIALYLVFCALLHGGENLSLKTCGLKHAGVEEQLKQLFTDAGFSVNTEKGRSSVCIFAGRLNQPELAAAFRKYLPGGELKYDGFAVAVDGNQVYLIGGEERSLIYAAVIFWRNSADITVPSVRWRGNPGKAAETCQCRMDIQSGICSARSFSSGVFRAEWDVYELGTCQCL